MAHTKRESGYRLKRFYLTNAGSKVKFAFAGEILQIIQASAPSANIKVYLNDPSADAITLKLHDVIALPYERFWLEWEAQSGHWLDLLISDNLDKRFHFADAISTFDGAPRVMGDISVTSSLSSAISPSKEVSAFVLINDKDSADPVYIGDASLDPQGSDKGDIILPTERKVFRGVNSSFNIYARCKNTETATLAVVEYD